MTRFVLVLAKWLFASDNYLLLARTHNPNTRAPEISMTQAACEHPHLASERNLALAVAFVLFGFVPSCRFMKSPGRSFLSGTIAWAILTVLYSVMELLFPRLATRLSAFHLFVLGCVVFDLLAALAWVMNLIVITFRQARQQQLGERLGARYAVNSR